MASLKRCRAVDAAAAQLIVREAGGQVAFIAVRRPAGRAAGPRAALAGDRRAHARGSRQAAPTCPSGRSASACHPGWRDRLEPRRDRGPPRREPAARRRPGAVRGSSTSPRRRAERLVSAYTGLVAAAAGAARRGGRSAGLDRGEPESLETVLEPPRSAGRRQAGPLGRSPGGDPGDRGRRGLRVPRRARAGPVRVPGARARRARAAAVRRARTSPTPRRASTPPPTSCCAGSRCTR